MGSGVSVSKLDEATIDQCGHAPDIYCPHHHVNHLNQDRQN